MMSSAHYRAERERLTVVELKDELRAIGLQVSGRKAILVERLAANDVRRANDRRQAENINHMTRFFEYKMGGLVFALVYELFFALLFAMNGSSRETALLLFVAAVGNIAGRIWSMSSMRSL